MAHLHDLIKFYCMLWLRHGELLLLLTKVGGLVTSIRMLRRFLKHIELYRRKNHSDILEVVSFLTDHLEGDGRLHGYKLHHLSCIHPFNLYISISHTCLPSGN